MQIHNFSNDLIVVHWKPCKHLRTFEPQYEISKRGMWDQQRLRPACAYAQSDQSLCLSLEYSMTLRLLTRHHLEFLSLKGGYTGSSESTLVKMSYCWKSNDMAHFTFHCFRYYQLCLLVWSYYSYSFKNRMDTVVLKTSPSHQLNILLLASSL